MRKPFSYRMIPILRVAKLNYFSFTYTVSSIYRVLTYCQRQLCEQIGQISANIMHEMQADKLVLAPGLAR